MPTPFGERDAPATASGTHALRRDERRDAFYPDSGAAIRYFGTSKYKSGPGDRPSAKGEPVTEVNAPLVWSNE